MPDLFDIKPGDTLLLLTDVERGIAIQKFDVFGDFANEIFKVKDNPVEADE